MRDTIKLLFVVVLRQLTFYQAEGELTSQYTTDTITKELTRKQQEDGSHSIGGDVIIQTLHGKDFRRQRRICCSASHNDNECILLFVERVLEKREIDLM